MSITKTFTKNMGRLAIDPNQAGLVAGYDMFPNGVTLEDKSGNGNHGTILGAAFEFTEIGPSMKFDGVADVIACGAGFQALTDLTVSFWMTLRSVAGTGWLFNYYLSGVDRWGIAVRTLDATTFRLDILNDIDDTDNFWYTQNLKYGQKYLVTAQMVNLENKLYINDQLVGSGNFSADYWNSFLGDVFIGSGSAAVGFSNTSISNLKIFNRAITPAEIQAEYQAGAKAINWKSDYGVDVSIAPEAAPGELSNSPVRKESGSHIITTDTIHGGIKKVIECVTAGVVQIPTANFHGDDTQAAYGSNRFWINKADASEMVIGFVSDIAAEDTSAIGYQLVFAADESIELRRVTGAGSVSLMKTVAAFFTAGAWHSVKTTRTSAGIITIYFDDTILDVTGGSGTNPVTDNTVATSKHWVIGSDAGDKVAWAAPNGEYAITKYQGVV